MIRPAFRLRPSNWRSFMWSFFIAFTLYGFYSLVETLDAVRLPQSDFPAELYSNQTQNDLRHTFVTAMEQAKESIILVVYSLTDSKIIQTLKKKSEEGVHVYVVVDREATPRWVTGRLGPQVDLIKRKAPGLMHQKILVIDGIQTWIGSANMTSESLRMHANLVAAIQSEPVAQYVSEKAQSLTVQGRSPLFPTQSFLLGPQTMELWFLPDNTEAVDRLLQLIEEAKESIQVAMFTWTRHDLTRAIIAAHKRGLKVEVVVDQYSGKGASSEVVAMLMEAGISVSLSRGTALLHHKMMIVDGRVLVNGSANWTKAAFTQNDDCFMVLYGLTEPQKERLETLWDVFRNETDLQTGHDGLYGLLMN